jgi:hypothetical protein
MFKSAKGISNPTDFHFPGARYLAKRIAMPPTDNEHSAHPIISPSLPTKYCKGAAGARHVAGMHGLMRDSVDTLTSVHVTKANKYNRPRKTSISSPIFELAGLTTRSISSPVSRSKDDRFHSNEPVPVDKMAR